MNKKNVNEMSIDEKIEWLWNLNRQHSDRFTQQSMDRKLYQARYPTQMSAFKCMDGRINIPYVTEIPRGIIKPFRNIGGYFDLGWPFLGEKVKEFVDRGVERGNKTIVLITYHFSKDDEHRGCAGFNYKTEDAFSFTLKFHKQVNRFFGEGNTVVFPIVIGLETDTDALIFHGEDPSSNNTLTISCDMNKEEDYIFGLLDGLYPNMDKELKKDLIPLIQGNISHICKIKDSNRSLTDMKHREWVLGLGRGFDWLHEPNTALIIGPYSHDLSEPVEKAIGIIADNMAQGRIRDDGFLVLASSPFEEFGPDRNRAIEKANFFKSYVEKILMAKKPEMLEKAKFLAVVLDENNRLMEEISLD